MRWNGRLASWICRNCVMLSCLYGPKSMRNVSSVLLDLCHKGPLMCGVPQGSILGPFFILPLYVPFRIDLWKIWHSLSQIYSSLKLGDTFSIQSLYECLAEVKCWLANNILQINEDKTRFILFGKKGCVEDIIDCLGLFLREKSFKCEKICKGDRAFSVVAPRLWNDFPVSSQVRSPLFI